MQRTAGEGSRGGKQEKTNVRKRSTKAKEQQKRTAAQRTAARKREQKHTGKETVLNRTLLLSLKGRNERTGEREKRRDQRRAQMDELLH